ncbi:MAG: peptide chain release factor aRF-1 [Candidatus ainarchaeum sp.]|nr:peptide chain release factor aRF-1 [Candidatus ainarchaeum sp.]
MANEHLEEVDEAEVALFKKKLKKMKEFKGRGTELISLYMPEDVDRGSVTGQITEEMSQSSNIKSPQTRKNVQGALRKIDNFLKQIDFRLPKNGLVVFCGNVSQAEGRSDIQLMTLRPIRPLRTKLYWCDSEFHLSPLEDMVSPKDVFGIVVLDKSDSTIAALIGKKYEILGRFTSGISGKMRAGGQCLSPESLIMLSDGNIVEIEAVHNPSGIKTADFEEGTVKDSFINDKWETTKPEAFKIITSAPRMEITSSKEHVFFCWENGAIKEKAAEELQEGEFLLLPEKINTKGAKQRLQSNFFNSFIILESGLSKIRETREKLGLSQKGLGKKIGLHQADISALELGKFNPRFKNLEKICACRGIDFNEFCREHCKPNSDLLLPSELGEELAQFAGYFLGDGHFENERIRLSEQRKEVAEEYEKLAKKIFNANAHFRFRETKNYFEVGVHGKPIVKFLKENFPELCGTGSIPKKVLKSENSVLAGFLRGLFDAEGYATRHHVGLGMNNEKLVKQVQLALLRFGIIASLNLYDNRRNPHSKKTRFTVQLNEKESLELFAKEIGFSAKDKMKKLEKLACETTAKSNVRQIAVSGAEIRKIIEKHGFKITDFPKTTNFFRNERMMGKATFRESIIGYAEKTGNKKLAAELEKALAKELLPAKISKIKKILAPTKMIDISVENRNFIANGLIVHNSAHRFERLHEEAAQEFYKRISEKTNDIFLPYGDKLKGVIVGGPGMTKNYFVNKNLIDHRIKKKILGLVDTSYTEESGIREVVQKADELLKDADAVKEKNTVNSFMEGIVKTGLAAYGQKEVEQALEIGKVSHLLVSDALEWMVFKFHCEKCGNNEELVVKEPKKFDSSSYKCGKCGSSTQAEVIEEIDYADWLMEKAQATGATTYIVSTDTPEGEQFYKGFGGIGAMLRYR